MGDDASGRVQNCRGRRVWCGIETEGAEQPRHLDLAIVHFAPLGSPPHTAVEFREPGLRRLRIDETRDVRDPTALVVRENAFGRIEELELRHLIPVSHPRTTRVHDRLASSLVRASFALAAVARLAGGSPVVSLRD